MRRSEALRDLPEEADTAALGAELSLFAAPGTAILLHGGLGAGKSTLARGLIRAMAPDAGGFEVPSPTFTLVQTYDITRVPVAHVDLYRLNSPGDLRELALDELIRTHLLVVEWPEKLGDPPPEHRLDVRLEAQGAGRRAALAGHGRWVLALERFEAAGAFLAASPWSRARRRFFEGDASFRRYERLALPERRAVLMDMPARPDGPPVKDGKSYSAVVHLAEDISAVLAVNAHLEGLGLSVPRTDTADAALGFAVIEDLGDQVYGRMRLAGEDMGEPMLAAADVLAFMAGETWPDAAPVPGGGERRIARYSRAALAMETNLLTGWFWPHRFGGPIPPGIREEFDAAWAEVLPLAEASRPVWTLRDYHSPNLLWLPERRGMERAGIIDTQDCVMGHPAYDLVSLLQDARVAVGDAEADGLLDRYCRERRLRGGAASDFRAAFALLGAQRATKILGIFARLSMRDGKPAYLPHIPRVSRYLERDLGHPALAPVARWFARHLHREAREAA